MNRFKVTDVNPIGCKDRYIDLSDYLKNKPIIKYDNTLYKGPKLVRSESGNHIFGIYEEIKIKVKNKKSIRQLLKEISIKLDLLLPDKNI